jgi:UbiD family decarboxylase
MTIEHDDLRDWLEGVEGFGELTHVDGAHWDQEIGGLAALYERQLGRPALLFDNVPGFDSGHRVLTNTLMSNRRIAYTFGADLNADGVDLVNHWRTVVADMPTLPVEFVDDGPVNDNVMRGSDVNVLGFPSPKIHEEDGGRYIGTGCVVIMNDPESDWINVGTYRVMVHDEKHVGLYISPGKHGRLIENRYWERGEACPVVISCGQDMLLTALGGIEVPYGVSEFEVAGGLRNRPSKVIESDVTGLPIPAASEIVLEGFIHPGHMRDEGQFGEWTGLYAGGRKPAPVVTVEAIRHRDRPILQGALTGKSPTDAAYYRGFLRAAMIWDQLEGAGIPGVKGVWVHPASGARLWVTVSIEQLYAGHSKQVGMVASQCHAGAYANRFVVVVDDDIDVTDSNEVTWAMCTRMDPSHDMTLIEGAWSTPLDPMAYPLDNPRLNNRLVVDACRPFLRLDTFPKTVEPSAAYAEQLIAKWGALLPEIRNR